MHSNSSQGENSRREFLKASAVTVAGASLLASAPDVHAAGSDVLKVGLIGCGGRGTGAAEQCCNADQNIQLIAMGDVFEDRVNQKSAILRKSLGKKYAVPKENMFVGFDAYKRVLASGVDIVCLATPPHFRPEHLRASIEAGVHVFCEKPVAVDAPGVRLVLETCKKAEQKNLSIVSGLCWRYHYGKRETFKRIHEGALGEILTMQCTYNTGYLWHKGRKGNWTDMEWQLRNWLYFTWLSGDHNVEQHVHSLDKMAWAMKDQYPAKAIGLGGRQTRVEEKWGNIFDHHAVVYEYANGVKVYSYCRQQDGTHRDVSDQIYGTKGNCFITGSARRSDVIEGANPWQYPRKKLRSDPSMYQIEHNELLAAIRSGKPINNGEYMTKSTMMAIMGRMATYTGQQITWEMALNSKEDLRPEKYEFCEMPVPKVAKPGVTKFV